MRKSRSTRTTAIQEVAQYLAGRVSRLPVLPFSQGEIGATREDFVEALFSGDRGRLVTSARSTTSREQYAQRIVAGGMPIAVTRSAVTRNRWFDDYVDVVLQRGVAEVANIRQRHQLPVLLRHLASRTAQLLNVTTTARAATLDRHTAADQTASRKPLASALGSRDTGGKAATEPRSALVTHPRCRVVPMA
ncbi:MAG: hypothetical protein ACYDEP_14400, partial [Acidimicrobiales bacterium]